MKAKKLSGQIKKSIEEAEAIIEQYMSRYPAVRRFYDSELEIARVKGCAFTILGRQRSLPEIVSSDAGVRWAAERQASNLPIQGTAADVVKLAMILCDKAGLTDQYGCHMLIQVHDELMFECPKETAQEAREAIKHIMEHALPTDLSVPLDVSIGIGPSWTEAK